MPVSGDYQRDHIGWVQSEGSEVGERHRLAVRIKTGINDHPPVVADVYQNTFTIAGARKTDLDLVSIRRSAQASQSREDCDILLAQASPRARSWTVMAGRSRKTMSDMRLRRPLRVYP